MAHYESPHKHKCRAPSFSCCYLFEAGKYLALRGRPGYPWDTTVPKAQPSMSISDQNIFANDANVPVARVVGTAFDPKP